MVIRWENEPKDDESASSAEKQIRILMKASCRVARYRIDDKRPKKSFFAPSRFCLFFRNLQLNMSFRRKFLFFYTPLETTAIFWPRREQFALSGKKKATPGIIFLM
jgi:hypothetical protein